MTVEPEQSEATGSASSERSAATGARNSTGSLAWEVVSQEERLEVPEDYYRLFTPAENALLDSTTAEGIGACELGPLRSLAAGLAPSGSWTGQSRVARAYRAGLSAFLVLEGAREVQVSSPSLSLRNRFYVCLRSQAYPQGYFTTSYRTFIRHCPHDRDGRLEQGSVSHGPRPSLG